MENQASSKSIIINYGLLFGGASILLGLISYAMGNSLEPGILITVLTFLLPIILIVLGINKFKSNNGGYMSWGQGVKVGIGIALIGALLGLIYQQIFINYIEPDFMNQLAEKTQQALADAGLDEDQIEAQMEMQKKFQSPGMAVAMGLLVWAFLGFVVSAIASAVMKKSEEDEY